MMSTDDGVLKRPLRLTAGPSGGYLQASELELRLRLPVAYTLPRRLPVPVVNRGVTVLTALALAADSDASSEGRWLVALSLRGESEEEEHVTESRWQSGCVTRRREPEWQAESTGTAPGVRPA